MIQRGLRVPPLARERKSIITVKKLGMLVDHRQLGMLPLLMPAGKFQIQKYICRNLLGITIAVSETDVP